MSDLDRRIARLMAQANKHFTSIMTERITQGLKASSMSDLMLAVKYGAELGATLGVEHERSECGQALDERVATSIEPSETMACADIIRGRWASK